MFIGKILKTNTEPPPQTPAQGHSGTHVPWPIHKFALKGHGYRGQPVPRLVTPLQDGSHIKA